MPRKRTAADRSRSFGDNLRAARVAAGLTPTQLAKRCGFARQTPISLWEVKPGHLPEPRTILKLAKVLGTTPAALLDGVVTPNDLLRGDDSRGRAPGV